MTSIEAELNCEWHIADLTLRIAQLKESSGLASDVLASAEFIDLLQQTLDSWEERKKDTGGAPLNAVRSDDPRRLRGPSLCASSHLCGAEIPRGPCARAS